MEAKESRADELTRAIIQIVTEHPNIQDTELKQQLEFSSSGLKFVSDHERAEIVNRLLTTKTLKIVSLGSIGSDGEAFGLVYQDPEELAKLRTLDEHDRIVLEIIKDSRERGLSTKEIKTKSNLLDIKKPLTILEKQGLIHSMKIKDRRNAKIYFDIHIRPSDSVTGGWFYDNGNVHEELIDEIKGAIIDKLANESDTLSFEQLYKRLRTVELSLDVMEEHVKSVLNVLILEDEVEEVVTGALTRSFSYRVSKNKMAFLNNAFTDIPCIECPVFAECHAKGQINPVSCIYFDEW